MDDWLRVGGVSLHLPSITYIEELGPASALHPGRPPRVRVGLVGGFNRAVTLEGPAGRALLQWASLVSASRRG